MAKLHKDDLLSDIYSKTARGGFVTLDQMETLYGASGSRLRPLLEDLKEEGMIVEHEEGFQVSRPGIDYCRSRWA